MGRFLYFRGWFLLIVMSLGLYSYLRDWLPGIVFSAIFLMGCVNLVFDMFNVYAEVLANPTPRLTLMLIIRLIGLWFTYLTVKNSSRLPDVKDRFNIMLPFKRDVWNATEVGSLLSELLICAVFWFVQFRFSLWFDLFQPSSIGAQSGANGLISRGWINEDLWAVETTGRHSKRQSALLRL